LRHSSSSNFACLTKGYCIEIRTQEIKKGGNAVAVIDTSTCITAKGSRIELRVGHEHDRYKKEVPRVPAITCADHQTKPYLLASPCVLVPWRLASGVSSVSSSSAQSPEHGGRSSFGCRRSTIRMSSGIGGRCSSPAQTATTTTGIRQELCFFFIFSIE
jgi:hypothetical protein